MEKRFFGTPSSGNHSHIWHSRRTNSVSIDKSDLPAAYRRICDETISDMIRQVAKDRGVSEDELTKEIDAKAEENMRLLAELD